MVEMATSPVQMELLKRVPRDDWRSEQTARIQHSIPPHEFRIGRQLSIKEIDTTRSKEHPVSRSTKHAPLYFRILDSDPWFGHRDSSQVGMQQSTFGTAIHWIAQISRSVRFCK